MLATIYVLFQRCDIVHYHALGPSLFSFVPKLVGKKTVVTVQGLDWQRKKWNPFASWVLRIGERAAIVSPDQTMVVSRSLQSHFAKRFRAETIYIPNGTPLPERRAIEQICGWGLEANQSILFLGRFSPENNCDLLIEAYEHLHPEVQLVLAGGASAADVYAQSLRKHASDKIRFFDYVSGAQFEELLANAMLFVLPSDLEGLSLALLEAMGAGLCVLASDMPENRELVDGAGFLFQAGNVIDLERMLRFLISDASARAWAGERAKQRIQRHYLWPDLATQVEAVYLDVLGWRSKDVVNSSVPSIAVPRSKPVTSDRRVGRPPRIRRAG